VIGKEGWARRRWDARRVPIEPTPLQRADEQKEGPNDECERAGWIDGGRRKVVSPYRMWIFILVSISLCPPNDVSRKEHATVKRDGYQNRPPSKGSLGYLLNPPRHSDGQTIHL
jgi:hypothetical protein